MKVLIVIWVTVMIGGMGFLERWELSPGAQITVQNRTRVKRSDWFIANMFFRPDCACTRATLKNLEGVASRFPGKVLVHAICVSGRGGTGWMNNLKREFPLLQLSLDPGGQYAKSMGAETSGVVLLFDPEGRNRFIGGITSSRGKDGDNPGLDALEDLIRGGVGRVRNWPVYGCSLTDTYGMAL